MSLSLSGNGPRLTRESPCNDPRSSVLSNKSSCVQFSYVMDYRYIWPMFVENSVTVRIELAERYRPYLACALQPKQTHQYQRIDLSVCISYTPNSFLNNFLHQGNASSSCQNDCLNNSSFCFSSTDGSSFTFFSSFFFVIYFLL